VSAELLRLGRRWMLEVVSRGEWEMLQGSQHGEVEATSEVSQVRFHSSNLGIEL